MGRPKKAAGAVASIKIDVRFTPGEKSALERVLAERKSRGLPGGANVSDWMRFHLRQDADALGVAIERPEPAQRSLFGAAAPSSELSPAAAPTPPAVSSPAALASKASGAKVGKAKKGAR